MSVIKPLPSWAIINRFPSFYDGESLTALEQTARLYGKVKELVETYNRYVTTINGELTELEAQVQKDLACAVRTIINLTDSYITQVELRLGHQDRKLDEAYKAFTEDITSEVDAIIRQMKDAGELDQVILDAIDNLNTKFENVQSTVAEEQAALRADYEVAKANLEGAYAELKQDFELLFGELEDEVKQSAAENALFREHTSVTLAEFPNGIVEGSALPVDTLKAYSIVGVQLSDDSYCICKLTRGDEGVYYIRGVGYSQTEFDITTYPAVRLSSVAITINSSGVVGYVGACWTSIFDYDGDNASMSKEQLSVTRIDGLVLNGGNIS